MYADDTVLLSETAGGLQNIIDTLHTYSTKWNFCVNIKRLKLLYLEIVRNCLPKKKGFIIMSCNNNFNIVVTHHSVETCNHINIDMHHITCILLTLLPQHIQLQLATLQHYLYHTLK